MILYDPKMHQVQEAYYGKTAILKQGEKLLEVIIDAINSNYRKNSSIIINDMKEAKELNKLLAAQFKLKECSVSFYQSNPITQAITPNMNAFTMPTNIGYLSKDTNFVYVSIDELLIYSNEFGSEEVMAVILHEIGHCLDKSLNTLISNIIVTPNIFDTIISFGLSFIMRTKLVAKTFQDIGKWITNITKSNAGINSIVMALNRIFIEYGRVVTLINALPVAAILTMTLPLQLINGIMPKSISGYNMEVYADSFATAYGYGEAISSFAYKTSMRKGYIVDSKLSKIPVVGFMADFESVLLRSLVTYFDPHPHDAVRIMNQIKKLERDLQSQDFDPSKKKMLLDDLNGLRKYMNDVVLNPETVDNKKNKFTYAFAYLNTKFLGGNLDFRNIFAKHNEE